MPARPARTEIARYRLRYRGYPRTLGEAAMNADLVHITDQALGHLAAALPSVPTVVTCHDILPFLLDGHYASRFHGWFDRTLLGLSLSTAMRSRRIIAVSHFTASALSHRFGVDPARIDVVPDIVDAVFRPMAGAETYLSEIGIRLPSGPRVLSVGHARPYKNLELLLRAMSAPALAGVSLIRAGAPLTPAQMELAAHLGIAARVFQLGTVGSKALAALYNACQVLAQPSWAEGFGLPVAEAMACGLLVVSSAGGALPEVVGDAGLVVNLDQSDPAGSERRLARALEQALTDSSLRSGLVARGIERVSAFRPEKVRPLLLASYARSMRG
jgi:glycosyltransferase involved in cell wall biosynthesis